MKYVHSNNTPEIVVRIFFISYRSDLLGKSYRSDMLAQCWPRCQNGKCINPGECKCDPGYTGASCGKIKTCSFLKPCFPGRCDRNSKCVCADGFTGSGTQKCKLLNSQQKPEITKCTTKLINLHRVTNKELYRYVTDSSSPNETEPDRMWSNQDRFNFINIYFEGRYDPPEIETVPGYINGFRFGVISGRADIRHTKIGRTEGDVVTETKAYTCSSSPGNRYPEVKTFSCNITDTDYTTSFESGDNVTITVTVNNGGYREVKNLRTGGYNIQYYSGQLQKKSMIFRFDYGKPYLKSSTANTKYLYLSQEITRSSFRINWEGWDDHVSGIFQYTWQVFRLEPNKYTLNLTEKDPLNPMHSSTILKINLREFPTYTPDAPGMYSIVLEVSDQANNTMYARSLVLYDSNPFVTINDDENNKIKVESAEEESDWLWQSTLDDETGTGSPIRVSWRGHFTNKILVDKKLLNPVNPFPQVRRKVSESKTIEKIVPPKFEDNNGKRSLKGIENIHGIVRFEYAFKKDHRGGSDSQNVPTKSSDWDEVTEFMREEVTFTTARSDGDTIRIWIKAFDVMGSSNTDFVTVHFDSSPPAITDKDTLIEKNQDSTTFYYSSRIQISVYDRESGIKQIRWKFVYEDTDEIFKTGVTHVHYTKEVSDGELSPQEGVCITTRQCFLYIQYVHFDNCWLAVPKSKLNSQVIRLELDVYNQAMLSTSKTLTINNLKSYKGIEDYNGPLNLTVVGITDTGVLISWEKMPTCYNITYITVSANSTTGTSRFYKIEKDETEFNLAALDPLTNYTMVFITHYEEEESDPVVFSVVTHAPKPSGLSAGGKAGVSLAILILVGIIIAGLVLWKTGHLAKTREVMRYRLTVYRKAAPEVTEYDDDIYMYGQMDMQGKQSWLIQNEDIVLEQLLTSGRFADIYMARYNTAQGKTTLVIAKTLKESFSDEDKVLMQAKINFYGTQVGDHPNVLAFIGSVEDNAALGPYMVMEFCETGNLRDWLQKQKKSVTEDVIESLHRLTLEVAKGMEHLANKEIIHRRLAARNVLLTEDLTAKIAGFGPTTTSNEQEGDDNSKEKERIPVKWVAPECIKSMKKATYESDVWSYGIVMWEIFSLGEPPYPGIRSKELPMRVKTGYRMKQPENASESNYDLMKRCWAEKPKSRPKFYQIVDEINKTYNMQPAADEYYMDA
ncbi:hypothetical protein FSP39_015547 [Pinctada imbricata]|uniref:Receptor protein-tyrosine kinase n=1 Tax=Pinctada imbricata TaxID=66713 RepID=A0AA89BPU0_PINIB|nr:hypothetical protein FSP39_015547 [Pinctada imbricata]